MKSVAKPKMAFCPENAADFILLTKESDMRNTKMLLCTALFMGVLACAILTNSGPTTAAGEDKAAVGNHWRHHDGHWSYWNEPDKQWYYTDGSNWFYNNGNVGDTWNVYGFDKQFGREGFERGEYKVPGTGAKTVTPNHATYRAPGK
jgi:hypothetical protein